MSKEVPSSQQVLSKVGLIFEDLAAKFEPGHKFTPKELKDLWRQAGMSDEIKVETYKAQILGGKRQRSKDHR